MLISGPYRVYFWSSDCEEARHIHVRRENQHAKFWLDPILLAASYGFRGKELRSTSRSSLPRTGRYYRRLGMSIAQELELLKMRLARAEIIDVGVTDGRVIAGLSSVTKSTRDRSSGIISHL